MFRSCFRANSIVFTRIRVIARHYGNTIVDNPFLHLASLKKFLGEPLVENRFDQASYSSLCPMFDAFFTLIPTTRRPVDRKNMESEERTV